MDLASFGTQVAHAAASGPLLLGLLAAALAGLVSFASPCVVPLVPGYMSYLASVVGADLELKSGEAVVPRQGRWRVAGAALLFVAGFTVIFVLATVTVFGAISALTLNQELLQRIGGIVTVVMGLAFLGLIPALDRDTRIQPKRLSTWLGAPLLGGVFALGWTPCLGPTLAAIMSVSAGTSGSTAARGVALIVAYCLGLGLPFVAVALGSAKAMSGVGWLRKHSRTIQIIGGVTLILVGLALASGAWAIFINMVRQWTVNFGYTAI
ncbi:cytochrome c biogenesis CcdA family protein [Staphylococcus chromogenes]|nr:cytochrome c biogenesis CcdA family protein [Staphylococcus chromogenes]